MTVGRFDNAMMAKLQVLLGERGSAQDRAIRAREVDQALGALQTAKSSNLISWTHLPEVFLDGTADPFVPVVITTSPRAITLDQYVEDSGVFLNPAVVTISGEVRGMTITESESSLFMRAGDAGSGVYGSGVGERVNALSDRWETFSTMFADTNAILGQWPARPIDLQLYGIFIADFGQIPVWVRRLTIRVEQRVLS